LFRWSGFLHGAYPAFLIPLAACLLNVSTTIFAGISNRSQVLSKVGDFTYQLQAGSSPIA
jgi:hypothetical protein